MNIIQIKNIQENIKNSINQQIIIRDYKLNFNEILYGFIFKKYELFIISRFFSQINLDFIKINIIISKITIINKINIEK